MLDPSVKVIPEDMTNTGYRREINLSANLHKMKINT